MTRAQISSEIIVAKIKVSRCNFDTSPTVLAELKQNGVSDSVLLAMIQAPHGSPVVEEKSSGPPSVQPKKIKSALRAEPLGSLKLRVAGFRACRFWFRFNPSSQCSDRPSGVFLPSARRRKPVCGRPSQSRGLSSQFYR